MKKLLVVLLAVVLVFGFAATAMAADTLSTAYPDISDKDQTVQDAFMKLSALDVFGGYADGTIKPDANITRAEFAKIACMLSGMADSADVLKGNASRFSDVAAGQWYTGYVNLATSQGLLSGYPDGTFKPNSNISMQEALTVLMRIAGYNDNLVGPWPLNYIAQGGKLDVTDDVAFAGSAPATRASIAVMASNILGLNVVYWDGDKSKFVEDTKTVRVFDEDDEEYDNVEVAITVLEDKFGAVTASGTIQDWTFDDFDDQEISIDCWGSGGDYELAEKYWITNGFVLWSFGNTQVDLIMNEDDEVVFIDVTSTFEFSDDVTTNSTSVDVGDDNFDYAAHKWIDSVDGETAKVYYDEDGDVYAVEKLDYDAYAPYVFETYNTTKDRIESYNRGNINLKDKDVAIIKNGQFVTAADLTDGELLYDFLPSGAEATYIVLPFAEGELTKGSATKLTIGGTAMSYAAGASYSSDAMDTFASIDTPDDVDDAYDTTVKYATDLANPFDLAIVIFEGGISNTIYGIITDVSANIDGQVSGLTILGSDGEEVDYDLVKDTGFDRPTYVSYWINSGDLGMGEAGYSYDTNDLTFGTYIEAKVSEDGTIGTKNIKKLADPVTASWTGDNDFDGLADTDGCDINNSRIKLGVGTAGSYYTLNEDTLVFETTITDDNKGFDEANVVDVADLIAADDISGGVLAFVDGGVVKQIFLVGSSLTSSSSFGVLDDIEYRGGDWYAILLDGSEYTFSDSYLSYAQDLIDVAFTQYEVGSGDVTDFNTFVEIQAYVDTVSTVDTITEYWFRTVAWETAHSVDYMGGRVEVDGLDDNTSADVNNNIISIGSANYLFDDDTAFYVVDEGKITEGDVYDLDDNDQLWAYTDVEGATDMVLEFVFIFHDTIVTP